MIMHNPRFAMNPAHEYRMTPTASPRIIPQWELDQLAKPRPRPLDPAMIRIITDGNPYLTRIASLKNRGQAPQVGRTPLRGVLIHTTM